MLIKGKNLNKRQREEVLNAFGYRWTLENETRARKWHKGFNNATLPTMPLQTDEQWLNEHAFHFVRDGSRMMLNRHTAEPHWMAA